MAKISKMTFTEKLLIANLVGEAVLAGLIIRSHNKQLDASVDMKTGLGIFPEEWMGFRINKERKECRRRAGEYLNWRDATQKEELP